MRVALSSQWAPALLAAGILSSHVNLDKGEDTPVGTKGAQRLGVHWQRSQLCDSGLQGPG